MGFNKGYIGVFILFFINLINYMDRYTVAGVLKEIQKYYDLNDSTAGLLQTSFIISYMLFAPLFGYLGDRYNRKYLMSFGILFWSLTTFLGSIVPADQVWIFFLMRGLVGIGEASYSTIAPTLIADLFNKKRRSQMLAFFYFAIPVGSGLGYIVSGRILAITNEWQWSLRVTPILGAVSVILVMFILDEPQRGHSDGAMQIEKSTLKEDVIYLTTVSTYIWSTLGFTCVCFTIGALSWWAPKYMTIAMQVQAADTTIDSESITLIFGVITCIGGIAGVFLGSLGAQYYKKHNHRADAIICSLSVFFSVPFVFMGLVLAHKLPSLTWFLIFIGITFLCMNWALVADILMYVIVPQRRSFAQSIQILLSHLLGDAASPFAVGLISDSFRGDDETLSRKYISLQYGLYAPCFVLVLGGLGFLYAASFIGVDQNIAKIKASGSRISSSSDSTPTGIVDQNFDESLKDFPPSDNNLMGSDTTNLVVNT